MIILNVVNEYQWGKNLRVDEYVEESVDNFSSCLEVQITSELQRCI